MEIDLTQLEADGARLDETFGPDVLAPSGVRLRYEPIVARLVTTIRPEVGGVRAEGELTATVRSECDRCLRTFDVDLRATFDQRYTWAGIASTGEESEVELAELDVEQLEAPALDTAALAREQVELAAPFRFVCAEDCKGLCPTCAANRNTTSCECAETLVDPRWEALKELKLK